MFPIIYLIFQMTSTLYSNIKLDSIRQYQPSPVLFSNIPITYFFLFHERKGFVTHQENKSDGNEIEFLFLNIFSHTLGNKTLTHVGWN